MSRGAIIGVVIGLVGLYFLSQGSIAQLGIGQTREGYESDAEMRRVYAAERRAIGLAEAQRPDRSDPDEDGGLFWDRIFGGASPRIAKHR